MTLKYNPRNVQIIGENVRLDKPPKIDSPLDFRVKRAQAERLEGLAQKYSIENHALMQQQQLKQLRAKDLQDSIGQDGKPNLDVAKGLFLSRRDWEGYQMIGEHQTKQAKAQQEAEKAEMAATEQMYEIARPNAIRGYNNPTWEAVEESRDLAKRYAEKVSPRFKMFVESSEEFLSDPSNNDPEKIKNFFASVLKPEDMKTTTVDFGDRVGSKLPHETVNEAKGQPPSSVAADSRAAANLNQRERFHAEKEAAKQRRHEEKEQRMWATKIGSRSKKTQAQAIKEKGAKMSAENSLKLIDEMILAVQENPRTTATPLAPLARFGAAVKGMFYPMAEEPTPAISFMQTRDLLLATADQLVRDSRMSNQDRARLENALGGNEFATNPVETINSLNRAKEIINNSYREQETSQEDDDWDTLTYQQKKQRMLSGE